MIRNHEQMKQELMVEAEKVIEQFLFAPKLKCTLSRLGT